MMKTAPGDAHMYSMVICGFVHMDLRMRPTVRLATLR